MDEFEDAFRSALRRVDTAPRPVATLEPTAVVARARASARIDPRTRRMRVLALVAALVLVAGIGLAGWLGRNQPVPATPAPAPSEAVPAGQVLVGPLTPDPASGFTVVMDDAALVPSDKAATAPDAGEQVPAERAPQLPGSYFVDGATIYLDDRLNHQIVSYRDGRRLDAVAAPAEPFDEFAVWYGTYYLLSDRLRAYLPEDGHLVETSLPEGLGDRSDISRLVVDDDNLIAEGRSGVRRLVDGPGPVPPAPAIESGPNRVTIVDAPLKATVQLGHSSTEVSLLGRDTEHAWYRVCESWTEESAGKVTQCYVTEFDADGRHTATYTPVRDDTNVFAQDLAVGGGQVYQMVFTGRSVQIRQLQPIPGPDEPPPSAAPTPWSDDELADVLGEPPTGLRWETYTPVDHPGEPTAVAVPEDWVSFASPSRSDCLSDKAQLPAPGPYLDSRHGVTQGHAITCPPLSDQQLHVSITDVDAQSDWTFPWAGDDPEWHQWSVALGHTIVTVTGRQSDEKLARQILATAHVVRRPCLPPESMTWTDGALPPDRQFGFVRHFDGKALYFDPAEWFSNEAAIEAAREDGEIGPDEDLPNPFYIRDPDAEIVRIPVSGQFSVTVIDGSNYPDGRTLRGTEFAQLYCPGADTDWLYGATDRLPVRLEVRGAQVMGAVEQYMP